MEPRRFFDPLGPMAKMGNYEYRKQQVTMANLVTRVLEAGHIGMVEAGTGTGKSLAYLYPAVCYAMKHKEKVVISTNTINLQEQLIHQDIPFLKSIGLNFNSVVVKGWSNYPCLVKMDETKLGADKTLSRWLTQLAEKIRSKQVESRTEVGVCSDELWEEIQAESDVCLRQKCPYLEECPIFQRKKAEEEADILIVNHHLLMADISVRKEKGWEEGAVLPEYYHVIFDEAHHVEEIATEYFGARLSLRRLRRLLGLFHRRQGRKSRGILVNLRERFFTVELAEELREQLVSLLDWQLIPDLRKLDQEGQDFFAELGKLLAESSDGILRLKSQSAIESESLLTAFDRFYTSFSEWEKNLRKFIADTDQLDKAMREKILPLIGLRPYLRRVEDFRESIDFLMNIEDGEHVYWLELRGKGKEVALAAAPIRVGPELRDNLFFKLKSAIFTSATLTVANTFDYYLETLGLDKEEWDIAQEVIPSPFDYHRQTYLGVPLDLPYPDSRNYPDKLAETLAHMLWATKGRTFVLFTSYRLLEQVGRLLRAKLTAHGFTFFVQGELPRHIMTKQFKTAEKAVLLGTDSFWEGVDVPGEALSCVIITRLPFRMPQDPVIAARAEQIEETGGNAFAQLFLPQAVIKFRQGFGRLIRSKKDKGVVLVCDRRVVDKYYGKSFLSSLPPCSIHKKSSDQIKQEVQQWLTY